LKISRNFCSQGKYIDIQEDDEDKNKIKFGKLVICPSPLGNLKDFSLRQLT
jgi:hypothetical protein